MHTPVKKFIPYEKLSKRKQREINAKKRTDWGNINPITRKAPDPKVYQRKKSWNWNDEFQNQDFLLAIIC